MTKKVEGDDAAALAHALRPVVLRLARHLRTETDVGGLTAAQIAILVAVELSPGLSAQKLAQREMLSEAGVSGHLARLEGRGLISRERDPDRRHVGLFLTRMGAAVVARVREHRTAWLTSRLEQMTGADRELISSSLSALNQISDGDR